MKVLTSKNRVKGLAHLPLPQISMRAWIWIFLAFLKEINFVVLIMWFVWACECESSCPQKPEALDLLGAGVYGQLWAIPNVDAGNWTQVLVSSSAYFADVLVHEPVLVSRQPRINNCGISMYVCTTYVLCIYVCVCLSMCMCFCVYVCVCVHVLLCVWGDVMCTSSICWFLWVLQVETLKLVKIKLFLYKFRWKTSYVCWLVLWLVAHNSSFCESLGALLID